MCEHAATTTDHTETTVYFAPGRYSSTDGSTWEAATNAPSAALSLRAFRVIFDAAGDESIDTTGDIDPAVLLGLPGLGPRGNEESVAWLRLVCRWARRRSMRVGFTTEQPTDEDE